MRPRGWSRPARAALALLGAVAACPPAAACPPSPDDGRLLAGASLQLAWRALPAPIRVSEPFELEVTLCPQTARLVRVDATMPEHRHGMNYRPSLQPLAPGRWRAKGLLWHMAGRWELRFDVEHAGAAHALRESIELR